MTNFYILRLLFLYTFKFIMRLINKSQSKTRIRILKSQIRIIYLKWNTRIISPMNRHKYLLHSLSDKFFLSAAILNLYKIVLRQEWVTDRGTDFEVNKRSDFMEKVKSYNKEAKESTSRAFNFRQLFWEHARKRASYALATKRRYITSIADFLDWCSFLIFFGSALCNLAWLSR